MAIYHLTIKLCREAVSKKVAYILREGKYGQSEKLEELREKWSSHLPTWARDAHDFWKTIEKHEKAGQIQAREIEVALPFELASSAQRKLVEQFCSDNLEYHAHSVAIHDAKSGINPHAHIYFCERKILSDKAEPGRELYCRQRSGYPKDREITGPQRTLWVMKIRKSWEVLVNEALQEAGCDGRVTCESFKKREINKLPQMHVGHKEYGLFRRTGKRGSKFARNEFIKQQKESAIDSNMN